MTIYFIAESETIGRYAAKRGRENRAFKIGYTISLTSAVRLGSLQRGNPRRLEIVREMEGDLEDERRLHVVFKHLRLSSEWFLLPPAVIRGLKRDSGSVDDFMESLPEPWSTEWAKFWLPPPPKPMHSEERKAREAIAARDLLERKASSSGAHAPSL